VFGEQEHQQQLAALRDDALTAERRGAEGRRAAGAAAAQAQQHATRAAELQACCEQQQARLRVPVMWEKGEAWRWGEGRSPPGRNYKDDAYALSHFRNFGARLSQVFLVESKLSLKSAIECAGAGGGTS